MAKSTDDVMHVDDVMGTDDVMHVDDVMGTDDVVRAVQRPLQLRARH